MSSEISKEKLEVLKKEHGLSTEKKKPVPLT